MAVYQVHSQSVVRGFAWVRLHLYGQGKTPGFPGQFHFVLPGYPGHDGRPPSRWPGAVLAGDRERDCRLHICIPRDDAADQRTIAGESSIHIDPHQVVKGKDADGTCSYSATGLLDHARDVGAGVHATYP